MAHDGFGQLVPRKRCFDQEELSTDLGFKFQCLPGHAIDFSYSESFVHFEYEATQQYAPGVCEAPWSSATDIPSIICYNEEAEVIARDNSESEYRACPELLSPEPVEVCYGCIPDVSVEFRNNLPAFSDPNPASDTLYILEVLPGPDYFVICAPSADEMIGFINLKTSCTLKGLQHIGKIRLEIALNSSEWRAVQHSFMKPLARTVEVSIFGMSSAAEARW